MARLKLINLPEIELHCFQKAKRSILCKLSLTKDSKIYEISNELQNTSSTETSWKKLDSIKEETIPFVNEPSSSNNFEQQVWAPTKGLQTVIETENGLGIF